MSQPTRDIVRIKEALSNLKKIPVNIEPAERPMIHIMRGLVGADNNLKHETEALVNLQNRIKEVTDDISRFITERAEYSEVLNASYTLEKEEAFLKRVEAEYEKWIGTQIEEEHEKWRKRRNEEAVSND